MRRTTITGGVVRPGQPSVGMHASGFPMYQHLPDRLDQMSSEYKQHVVAAIDQVDESSMSSLMHCFLTVDCTYTHSQTFQFVNLGKYHLFILLVPPIFM